MEERESAPRAQERQVFAAPVRYGRPGKLMSLPVLQRNYFLRLKDINGLVGSWTLAETRYIECLSKRREYKLERDDPLPMYPRGISICVYCIGSGKTCEFL